jgi:hypothetical protein
MEFILIISGIVGIIIYVNSQKKNTAINIFRRSYLTKWNELSQFDKATFFRQRTYRQKSHRIDHIPDVPEYDYHEMSEERLTSMFRALISQIIKEQKQEDHLDFGDVELDLEEVFRHIYENRGIFKSDR